MPFIGSNALGGPSPVCVSNSFLLCFSHLQMAPGTPNPKFKLSVVPLYMF